MSSVAEMFVQLCTQGDSKRNADLVTPEDVIRFDNILYGKNTKWNVLDIYRPREVEGDLPVIINVHGGGWVYGDKDVYQYYCMHLAQKGFVVVNFSYRLAPEYVFPASIEDMNEVVSFTLANCEKYGMDKNNIFLMGDSAGAHMAALYACICTNSEYAQKYNFTVSEGFVPKAIVLNCGIYDAVSLVEDNGGIGRVLRSLLCDYIGKQSPEKEELELVSPIKHINEKYPPCLIMTSTGDFLRNQPDSLLPVLQENAVNYAYKIYGDEENTLDHVFHCDIRQKDAIICNEDEAEYLLDLAKK